MVGSFPRFRGTRVTENTDDIELRLFARRIGMLDMGGRHLPTDWPTGIGVLPTFTGVLDAPVHRTGGPPVDLSYLTLAPVVSRALVARGSGSDDGSAGMTSAVSETAADERSRDDRTEPGTELTVREVLREQGSTDTDAADRERSDGDDGADAQTDPDSTVRTVMTVDREWARRTPTGVNPPTVTGPRRTVLDLTSPDADAPDAADRASSTPRSGDPGQRSASPTNAPPEPGDLSVVRKSVDASTDRDQPPSSDLPTLTETAPGDRDIGGGRTGAGDVDSPSVSTAVEEVTTPRLTVHSNAAAGTPSGQVDDAGPTPPSGRGVGQDPPAAAVGGPDVGESAQAGDGEPRSGTTGPAMTVRRTAPTNRMNAGRDPDARSGSRTDPSEQVGEPMSGFPESADRGGPDSKTDLLAALRENGDATRLVDELYRRISRRMAIERDRRGG